ncbi:MAG: hypothetical protein LBL62_11650 [Planctomycetaceae bacterium]|jgi:hypothetical protein|nr:hypothetical protein [Planctomycetaceae bacterium]
MDNEEILNQLEKLVKKYGADTNRQLFGTAFKGAMEAKRFAKSNRLLMPYLDICYDISSLALNLSEPEIGIDNALEIIALVESEEKARKFQNDYDRDDYQYTVHWLTSNAYYDLARNTAHRYGSNSPVVHGAVDDGIHICRRTDNLDNIVAFRDFATENCLASGDYEMGEHYARTRTEAKILSEGNEYLRYLGFRDLCILYIRQGKFNAAWEAFHAAIPITEVYHNPMYAKIDFAHIAELLYLMTGRETEFLSTLQSFGFQNEMPEIPPRDENTTHHFDRQYNNIIRLVNQSQFSEAENILVTEERFLLAREHLKNWFDARVQRIAARLMSGETKNDFETLTQELRQRASKACQWSAILSLDTMLSRRVKLNPLGIPFPIDIGLYATEGTPLSTAQLKTTLPLAEKSPTQTSIPKVAESATQKNETEKSPLILEVETWLAKLEPLWEEFYNRLREQNENITQEEFPKREELETLERNILDTVLKYTPETPTGSKNEPINEAEFLALTHSFHRMSLLNETEWIQPVLSWFNRFLKRFAENGRVLSAYSYYANHFRKHLKWRGIDPKDFGLPEDKILEEYAVKAFELEPNRLGVAITVGDVFKLHGNNREAQRYFARACQLDRLNDYAAENLAKLYEAAERPKDALATIDLYIQAGGQNPEIFWDGMQTAFRNDMPQEFLFYYKLYTEKESSYPLLDCQRIWAFVKLEQFDNALEALNKLDERLGIAGLDRMFLRALCQAELGDESWTKTFDEALKLNAANSEQHQNDEPSDAEQGLFGTAYDPCERLWDHVCKLPTTDVNRLTFEQFLFERGLIPQSLLHPEDSENEDDENSTDENSGKILLGYYRCILRQPLDPQHAAYAGWLRIPPEDKEYFAMWFVLAKDETEAIKLACEIQNRCYPLPAEPVNCEQLDSYYAKKSHAVFHAKRFPKYEQEE